MMLLPVLAKADFRFDSTAKQLFKLAHKYRPETKVEKKLRLREAAEKKEAGKEQSAGKKPIVIKYGLNHVTSLVEQKKAQLVVIAHDVDPIEVRQGKPYGVCLHSLS